MIAPQDERTVIPAHTPKRLEDQALENFVHMVVQHSVPASLHCDLLPQVSEVRWSDDPNKLDRIIMTSESTWPELLPQKHLFMEHLKKLKHWWDDNEWLGKQNSQIRRQIKECFTMELELVDPHCKYPLFKFLLHLMFSTKALGASDTAEFPHYPKVQLELRRNGCPVYADVLRSLKPFVIEELSTQYIIFGDTEPWIVIIENSPFLKKVHLRKNICEEILLCIGQNCPQLDTFILEQVFGSLMVPIDCLYKTFFSGLDYESVNTLTSGIPSNMQKYLSFPRLKFVDLGSTSHFQKVVVKKQSLTEFLYNLLFFYPDIGSISCHYLHPFVPLLPTSLPEHCHSLSYNIKHIDLIGLMPWIQHLFQNIYYHSDGKNHVESAVSTFRQLQHLTLCHCMSIDTSVESIQENAKFAEIWIPKFRCKKLTIHLSFTPPEDMRNGETLSLYIPLFRSIGHSLCVLHFHLFVSIDVCKICQLISLCPNLELLGIRLLAKVSLSAEENFNIQRLPHLTSLSVACSAWLDSNIVNSLVEKLISASPVLTNLELMLAHGPCEWLMGMAVDKMLNGIRTLRLSFGTHCVNDWGDDFSVEVGASFYVPLIELLPDLEVLMLGIHHIDVLTQLKLTYRTSQFKIVVRRKPYIGYDVLNPM
ncbi:uncharacterized protein LOC121873595 [Homarus americanus]|uniref:uncharacterized protein LOC121873595 n=1 Tax=Homarus americanus TaxID=6706 RepID=UPI001C4707A0|nr:uncharacterized protein LOC121873595 [Homarus americanus]XP_042233172.1 uncharacterized protein LOC121873595 [Homarus americanus]XP_042233175.1 uncharacterized protein LOC121873595 [Homarus americanus]XP_042233176.1 uncharacterized protein LOC121873595 [Homarus americanus]